MSGFMSWILSILGIVIIGTLLDIFLSEKKLGKMIRSVIASLVVLIIITPLPSLLGSRVSCDNFFDSEGIQLDDGFLTFANNQKIKALEEGVVQAYAEKGYKNIKVSITATIDTEINVSLVKIYLADLVMENLPANINKIEKIRELCVEFLKITKDKILIYE